MPEINLAENEKRNRRKGTHPIEAFTHGYTISVSKGFNAVHASLFTPLCATTVTTLHSKNYALDYVIKLLPRSESSEQSVQQNFPQDTSYTIVQHDIHAPGDSKWACRFLDRTFFDPIVWRPESDNEPNRNDRKNRQRNTEEENSPKTEQPTIVEKPSLQVIETICNTLPKI